MSIKINLRYRNEWNRHGLLNYSELVELPITKCNLSTDAYGECGEWFFVPESLLPSGHRVIYFGYAGLHLPNESAPHIYSLLFDTTDPDEMSEFAIRVQHWQSQPERDPQP